MLVPAFDADLFREAWRALATAWAATRGRDGRRRRARRGADGREHARAFDVLRRFDRRALSSRGTVVTRYFACLRATTHAHAAACPRHPRRS